MPNHITNKVSAPSHVLKSLINEQGQIDFNTILPFGGKFPWDGISGSAETAAEAITAQPLNDHPIIAALEKRNRAEANALELDDECFEQFVQMLRNKRSCGHFHTLDFARDAWGTKWNAYDQVVDLEGGELSFDTAWSCPLPVLKALSSLHLDSGISVRYADEDIGSNCGTLKLRAGEVIEQDVAGQWDQMSEEQQAKWRQFAMDLKGWTDGE